MNEQYSQPVAFKVNGREYSFVVGRDFEPEDSLAVVLREKLGFTGVKLACGQGACGACTVLLNGETVLSCMMLAVEAQGGEILTADGLPEDDPVIAAFVEMNEPDYGTAMQCGFCTPGMILASECLLAKTPNPSEEEIRAGISGNLCRCTGYNSIVKAIGIAAKEGKGLW